MSRHRTRTRLGALVAAIALTGLAAGCAGPDDRPSDAPADASPGPSAETVAAARAIYERESCGMCHGAEAEGTELAPALRDLGGFWDEDRLSRYLQDPEAFRRANPAFEDRRDEVFEMDMPPYDHVSDEDRRAVARWLLSR